MKKRGLSNLIATVLIVLLALAAVALVWGFLKPAFERTGTSIDLRTKCFNVEVHPMKCEFNTGGDTNMTAIVTVKLISGEAAEVYTAVQYDDDTANAGRVTAPPVLATTNIMIINLTDGIPLTAKAAGVVTDEQGNTEICTESPVTVDCIDAIPA
ncbi:MAG: hypothetical protein KJ718_02030 [Nanoarchaeota archaeon]|nr:hypothetical protein [Nanoarchaeota archaeon]MBU1051313.1 hypothetical protein [Nanoarchaeota archaeon]MBU1988459.1 hypothetical protein [Nanoarchaeota archaeon]